MSIVSHTGPVVIVGAAGFIGRALTLRLAARGVPVLAVTRSPVALGEGIAVRSIGDLTPETDWRGLIAGARAVVHLATRAHAPLGTDRGWIAREAGAAGALAAAAREGGVGRLVLLSSIKVLGDRTLDRPVTAASPLAPADAYGEAKCRIEAAMREAAGALLVVLRPPLVYGPGVKANFRALLRLVDRGLPLPFASLRNRRALVFLENLIDLIELALTHAAAPRGTFLLRDAEEVSTPELVRRMARQLERPARLSPCPPELLRLAATIAGRRAAADRLLGSLSVDDSETRVRLGWQPRFSLDDGLAATCRWYREAS